MQLIGYLDSPFVRGVAITMKFLGIEYQHRELSIFRDYDEFRTIIPRWWRFQSVRKFYPNF